MSALARQVVARPVSAAAVGLVVLALGAIALLRLPVALVPEIVYPMLRVQVSLGSAPAELMLDRVTRPLELELAQVEGVELIESSTEQGETRVTLSFPLDADIQAALRDVTMRVERARAKLPPEAAPPTIVRFDPSNLPVLELALGSDALDALALRRLAERDLVYQLTTVPGVSAVRAAGGLERELRVELLPERLTAFGLTGRDVAQAVRAAHVAQGAGRADLPERELAVLISHRLGTAEAIAAVQIPNSPARVGDVARVLDDHREPRLLVRIDGKNAVKLSIYKQPGANTVAVVDALRERLEQLDDTGVLPRSVRLVVTADESTYVRAAMTSARRALLEAFVIVAAVVLVSLRRWRLSLLVCATIPVALAATLALMHALGLTLNLMSLGGLVLGVGLLIDYAVVLVEAGTKSVDDGAPGDEAARRALSSVGSPLVASTTTHVVGVLPFLALTGLTQLLFRELIITATVATAAGLLAALFLIPPIFARMRPSPRTGPRTTGGGSALVGSIARRLASWPRVVVVVAALAMALSVGGITQLGYVFLPELDDGRVTILVRGEPGVPLRELDACVRRLEAKLTSDPVVASVDATVGGRIGQTVQETPGEAELLVQLVAPDERDRGVRALIRSLGQELSEAAGVGFTVTVKKARIRAIRTFKGQAATGDWDVAVRIAGPDLRTLTQISSEVKARLAAVEGLGPIGNALVLGTPEMHIEVDGALTGARGVTPADVAEAAQLYLRGEVPVQVVDEGFLVDLRVILDPSARSDPRALARAPACRGRHGPCSLAELARVRDSRGPREVVRVAQQNVDVITANQQDDRPLSRVAADVRASLAGLSAPPGYSLTFAGRMEVAGDDSASALVVVALLSLLLVLAVLAIQYESVRAPLLVVSMVPFGLIGVLPTFWLAGMPLSATALVGVVLLAGIGVNASVLLVDSAEHARAAGLSARDAAAVAAAARARPIVMTSAAATLGLAPLVFGLAEGGELLRPLALVILGGVATSALGTLFVLPALYSLVLGSGGEGRTS